MSKLHVCSEKHTGITPIVSRRSTGSAILMEFSPAVLMPTDSGEHYFIRSRSCNASGTRLGMEASRVKDVIELVTILN
jgi:adenylosuccinate synthase